LPLKANHIPKRGLGQVPFPLRGGLSFFRKVIKMIKNIKRYFREQKVFVLEMQILNYAVKHNIDFWRAVDMLPQVYEKLISLKRSAR